MCTVPATKARDCGESLRKLAPSTIQQQRIEVFLPGDASAMIGNAALWRAYGPSNPLVWPDDDVGGGRAAFRLLAFILWRLAFRLLLISGCPSASCWSVVLPDLKLTMVTVRVPPSRLYLLNTAVFRQQWQRHISVPKMIISAPESKEPE